MAAAAASHFGSGQSDMSSPRDMSSPSPNFSGRDGFNPSGPLTTGKSTGAPAQGSDTGRTDASNTCGKEHWKKLYPSVKLAIAHAASDIKSLLDAAIAADLNRKAVAAHRVTDGSASTGSKPTDKEFARVLVENLNAVVLESLPSAKRLKVEGALASGWLQRLYLEGVASNLVLDGKRARRFGAPNAVRLADVLRTPG